MRLHNAIYVPSYAFGSASIPMAPSLMHDVLRGSSFHVLKYMKKPPEKEIGVWVHEVRKDLQRRRLDGTLHSPLKFMAVTSAPPFNSARQHVASDCCESSTGATRAG